MARAGLQASILKGQTTTFKYQQQNDRSATSTFIDKHISGQGKGKFGIAATDGKLDVLEQLRDKKILERERGGRGSTRLSFPEQHNQDAEDRWLRQRYATL